MKIMMELTEWAVPYRQPNHVYLMDGDRALAYVPWGQGQPITFARPSRMDLRGRRFVEVKRDIWGFDVKPDRTDSQSWQVTGTAGNVYTVTLSRGRWRCTCAGFQFRQQCRHIQECQVTAK